MALTRGRSVLKASSEVQRDDLFASIAMSAELLQIEKDDIRRIQLSTTVSTNAIVENKIAKLSVIIKAVPALIGL